jgi:hypothetical protein
MTHLDPQFDGVGDCCNTSGEDGFGIVGRLQASGFQPHILAGGAHLATLGN